MAAFPLARTTTLSCLVAFSTAALHASQPWSIGTLSAEEQFYVELINRARANPAAEGVRLAALKESNETVASSYDSFDVNLALMQKEMRAIAPAPPLVPVPSLRRAALKHSRDMARSGSQSHIGSDWSTFDVRAKREGYAFTKLGENIFTESQGAEHAHAGFEVDWGNGRGGMQPDRGHRANIHNPRFRDIGVGAVQTNALGKSARFLSRPGDPNYEPPQTGARGPQVVTQLLGASGDTRPFLTGVSYVDCDNDSFYSPGEGVGSVKITVEGNGYHAVSTSSGGFALPLPGDGQYLATFFKPGFGSMKQRFAVRNGRNTKVDLRAASAPVLRGPGAAKQGGSVTYSLSRVLEAKRFRLRAAPTRRALGAGAEDEQTERLEASDGDRTIPLEYRIQSSLVAEGEKAFSIRAYEKLRFVPTFVPSANGKLTFRSCLKNFSYDDVQLEIKVEVRSRGRWQQVFRQTKTDTAFRTVSINLAPFAGEEIAVRFEYSRRVTRGSDQYYDGDGWHIDAIELPAVAEVMPDRQVKTGAARTMTITPDQSGLWWVRAEAEIKGRFRSAGPGRVLRVDRQLPN